MFVYALGLAAAAAPTVYVCTDGLLSLFEARGTLQITGSNLPRPARLQFACPGGSMSSSFALIVPDAANSGFDFDNFLEPEAPAGALALSDIRWTSASVRAAASAPATGEAGWDASFSLRAGRANAGLGDLLASINGEPGTLAWTQTSFENLNRRFVATFELDASGAASLRDAFEKCASQQSWLPPL